MSNLDPIIAISSKNETELRKALEFGWQPPKIEQKYSGLVNDLILWGEVLSNDWKVGLEVLDKYFPDITRHESIWHMAFSKNSIECIKYLWAYHYENINDELIIKKIMLSMGSKWKTVNSSEITVKMLDFLKEKNLDIYRVIQGDFEYGDLRIEGHNLWTRAVFLSEWTIVNHFWPKDNSWKNWNRCSEVMCDLMGKIVEDIPSPIESSHKKEFKNYNEKKVFLRWIEDFGIDWLKSKHKDLFPKPNEFYIQDENMEEDLYFHVSKASHLKISPWLRLVLYFNEEERKVIWKVWEDYFKLLDNTKTGNDLLWLKTLALYPNDDDVLSIIEIAKKDNARAFIDYWDRKTADNISPSQIFNGDA